MWTIPQTLRSRGFGDRRDGSNQSGNAQTEEKSDNKGDPWDGGDKFGPWLRAPVPLRSRGFGDRRDGSNQSGNAQTEEKSDNEVHEERGDQRRQGTSDNQYVRDEVGKKVNSDSTSGFEVEKENVDPVPDSKVLGVAMKNRVILGMVDGNVMDGPHVTVTVKVNYLDNAMRKDKRRTYEKREAQTENEGDAVLKKRSLNSEEDACGLRKRGSEEQLKAPLPLDFGGFNLEGDKRGFYCILIPKTRHRPLQNKSGS
ncbi:hypothetical protein ACOSP7_027293 [Xanthoceras sorbifolium]